MVKKKYSKGFVAFCVVILFLIAGMLGMHFYAKDYYTATQLANTKIAGDARVTVDEKEEYYHFFSKDIAREETQGIIFYPGAKVDEKAYAPLLYEFADLGYDVFLVKMPMKLAILGKDRAQDIIKDYKKIKDWTIMGHSLGGAMAADFASQSEEIDCLVMLAAYSTKDLKGKNLKVLQMYGSEDQVLNRKSLEKYQDHLPEDAVVLEIDGANHANYGYYGKQKKDGEAKISREEQQKIVLDLVLAME